MARIASVGLWHLGCVASAALASLGHTVCGTDPDAEVVHNLQQGVLPIYEPGLAALMAEQTRQGKLDFRCSPWEAFEKAEFIFLTFDTPVDENDQSNLTPLESALQEIARHVSRAVQIVVMSQIPVGTCQRFAERLRELAPQLPFSLVYQPENLRLGEALETFLRPDFLLVGAQDKAAAGRLLRLYDGILAPKLVVSWSSAEMAKHALNAFLATSISFANELADLADLSGADVRDVVRTLRLDRRIGEQAFLSPGPGFSGGTLGRDVQTLRGLAERAGRKARQLDATLAVNASRIPDLVARLRQVCGPLGGLRLGLLGLTYKPGTSTLRRSHALTMARLLAQEGAEVRGFDPQVAEPRPETMGILICPNPYQAAENADGVLLATPWPEFQTLDFARLGRVMRRPVLLDAHNCLDDRKVKEAGFRYCGRGIPAGGNLGFGGPDE